MARLPHGGERKKLIILARLLKLHPAELRADFQRYYGLNLDGMGSEYTVAHAADLAACLPTESCSMTAEDPLNGWTREHQLLAIIEYHLALWNWAHTKDAKSGRNKPRLLMPQPKGGAPRNVEAMTREELGDFIDGLVGPSEDTEGGEADGQGHGAGVGVPDTVPEAER